MTSKYSSALGAQAIARSVVNKQLVDSEASQVLILALETGRTGFGEMTREPATGKDTCWFDVCIKDDKLTKDAEDSVYRLEVNVYQGSVTSANWILMAG